MDTSSLTSNSSARLMCRLMCSDAIHSDSSIIYNVYVSQHIVLLYNLVPTCDKILENIFNLKKISNTVVCSR